MENGENLPYRDAQGSHELQGDAQATGGPRGKVTFEGRWRKVEEMEGKVEGGREREREGHLLLLPPGAFSSAS